MSAYEWKEKQGQFSSGENLTINGFIIGSYYYNSSRPKGCELSWQIRSELPCLRPKTINFKTAREAKDALEKFTTKWFLKLNVI